MTAPPEEIAVVEAYSATAEWWQTGPGRVYDRLARELVAASPVMVRGADVLDVGTGTGAATRAALEAGAERVVPVDAAIGMLRVHADRRPPPLCGDARALPLRSASMDLAIAAFSLNHLSDPVPALRDLARILGPGGGAVVGSYGVEDSHPVKDAVEQTLAAAGWRSPSWHRWLKEDATVALSTVESSRAVAARAGLHGVRVEQSRIPFPDLDSEQLVAWRFGMAQHAPFLATLPTARRARLLAEACDRLGAVPALVRSVVVLTFRC